MTGEKKRENEKREKARGEKEDKETEGGYTVIKRKKKEKR